MMLGKICDFLNVVFFFLVVSRYCTVAGQKMKFSIKDFFSKCDQIRSILRIWSHLLKKPLMGNLIFCAVVVGQVLMHVTFSAFSFDFI